MGGQRERRGAGRQCVRRGRAPISLDPGVHQAEGRSGRARRPSTARVLGLVSGEGVCRGRTDLRAGKVIKIDRHRPAIQRPVLRARGQPPLHAVQPLSDALRRAEERFMNLLDTLLAMRATGRGPDAVSAWSSAW